MRVLEQFPRPDWLALMIGNSRWHWAWFQSGTLQQTWDTAPVAPNGIAALVSHNLDLQACGLVPPNKAAIPPQLPLVLASVVPAQIPLWQTYPQTQIITLNEIPIANLYPTLGVDRALALLGATSRYGPPCLVIDAGTALTVTGVDATPALIGGAILPGLQLQLRSLGEHTAALPILSSQQASQQAQPLPPRWATNTPDAIWSGVLYTLLAGLQDFIQSWQQQFVETKIVLTGGDAPLMAALLRQHCPDLAPALQVDGQLIFWGMQQVIGEYSDSDTFQYQ